MEKEDIMVFESDKLFDSIEREEMINYLVPIFKSRTKELEYDSNYKQAVVYLLLKSTDDLLAYVRVNKNENRLYNLHSIGFGGHVSSMDLEDNKTVLPLDIIHSAIYRELKEETNLDSKDITSMNYLGVINISDSEIDKYHIGFVYLLETSIPFYEINFSDDEISSVYPVDPFKYNVNSMNSFESWTRFILSDSSFRNKLLSYFSY